MKKILSGLILMSAISCSTPTTQDLKSSDAKTDYKDGIEYTGVDQKQFKGKKTIQKIGIIAVQVDHISTKKNSSYNLSVIDPNIKLYGDETYKLIVQGLERRGFTVVSTQKMKSSPAYSKVGEKTSGLQDSSGHKRYVVMSGNDYSKSPDLATNNKWAEKLAHDAGVDAFIIMYYRTDWNLLGLDEKKKELNLSSEIELQMKIIVPYEKGLIAENDLMIYKTSKNIMREVTIPYTATMEKVQKIDLYSWGTQREEFKVATELFLDRWINDLKE